MEPIRDLAQLLTRMEPVLDGREWVFCSHGSSVAPAGVETLGTFVEDEGLSLILERREADRAGLAYHGTFARITLRVHSSLEAVGLTAAVAGALAKRGIAANVVAAFHHDHLFVPWSRGAEALEVLLKLQREA